MIKSTVCTLCSFLTQSKPTCRVLFKPLIFNPFYTVNSSTYTWMAIYSDGFIINHPLDYDFGHLLPAAELLCLNIYASISICIIHSTTSHILHTPHTLYKFMYFPNPHDHEWMQEFKGSMKTIWPFWYKCNDWMLLIADLITLLFSSSWIFGCSPQENTQIIEKPVMCPDKATLPPLTMLHTYSHVPIAPSPKPYTQ